MYICENVNRNNFKYLIYLNSKRENFNKLNEDFIEEFNKQNVLRRHILKKNAHLLRYNDNYIGFMWVNGGITKNNYDIACIQICDEYVKDLNVYRSLIDSFKYVKSFSYRCEENLYNYKVLEKLQFKPVEGVFELENILKDYFNLPKLESITIEKFKKSEEEQIRCDIQNQVFEKDDRIPICIEDIIYDENQDYYIDDGSFFIKKNGVPIGYGQFIIKNEDPIIVNFGILSRYRGNGYGKYFLKYILNYLKTLNYKKALIKVDISNNVAINLYKSVGFIKRSKCVIWEKKL